MSIMSSLRDTAASLAFDRALQGVRDLQIQRLLDGRPMGGDELREAEKSAVLGVARHFYNDDTALAMGLAAQAGERDHKRDYAGRAQAPADQATLFTHRLICALPVVGDPANALPGLAGRSG
jgi:hypothetical protein